MNIGPHTTTDQLKDRTKDELKAGLMYHNGWTKANMRDMKKDDLVRAAQALRDKHLAQYKKAQAAAKEAADRDLQNEREVGTAGQCFNSLHHGVQRLYAGQATTLADARAKLNEADLFRMDDVLRWHGEAVLNASAYGQALQPLLRDLNELRTDQTITWAEFKNRMEHELATYLRRCTEAYGEGGNSNPISNLRDAAERNANRRMYRLLVQINELVNGVDVTKNDDKTDETVARMRYVSDM